MGKRASRFSNGFPVEYDIYGIAYVKCSACEYYKYELVYCCNGDYTEFGFCSKGNELHPRKCGDGKWKI